MIYRYWIIKIIIIIFSSLIFPQIGFWAVSTWSSSVNLQAQVYEIQVNASFLNPLSTFSANSVLLSWTTWSWTIDKSFLVKSCIDNNCNNVIWDSGWLWDVPSYSYNWLELNNVIYFSLDTIDYNNEWWNWSNVEYTTVYDPTKIEISEYFNENIWTWILAWILNAHLPSSTWMSIIQYLQITDLIWLWGMLYETINFNLNFSSSQLDSRLGQLMQFNPETNLWELILYWKNLLPINKITSQKDIEIAKIIYDENQLFDTSSCENITTNLAIAIWTWGNICSDIKIQNSNSNDSLLLYSWTNLFDSTQSGQIFDWILQWPVDITDYINEQAGPGIVYEDIEKIVEVWAPWRKIDLMWTWATITFNVETDWNYSIRYFSWSSWHLYDFNMWPSSWSITINVNTLTKYSINKEIFIPWTIFIFCPEYLDFPASRSSNVDTETIIDIAKMDYWYIIRWIADTWAYFWVNDQKSSNTWYYITMAIWEFEVEWSSGSLSSENMTITLEKWTWAIKLLSQQSIIDTAPPEIVVPGNYDESQFITPITLLSRTLATTPISWIKWVYWVQPIFKIFIPKYQPLGTYSSVMTLDLIEL